ncbi:HlyD-family secretion protein [Escherichia coli]|uniref:HlyD-family secretion protein n=1 Tax=Escherichia coli TaxID=562 RepID=A0A376LLE2_ECOLX|nr:HlyD-family secretion protein [Escherichia coli]
MTMRRTSITASKDCGKAAPFRQMTWENARSSRDQAQATLKSAQDKLRQYRSGNREQDIAQAKASLEQAQAQLAQAELNLQDSTLIAPSDGTLLTRAVEPGTVLNEGGTVFTVSLTHPVWVRAYVDERNLDQAQPGAKCCLYRWSPGQAVSRADLVSFRRLLNLPRKPSKHRICVPTSSIACVLW